MVGSNCQWDYDVIVLGGGAAGKHCAGELAEGGLRVAVVERDRVGGECSYWADLPVKTLLRPGAAVQGALGAGARAEVNVAAALAWRDLVVANWSDAGQERWLADRGIQLLRGTGRLAGVGAVDVDGVLHTAEQVVVATGSDAVVPPLPGLAELDGVWGNRQASSMDAIPGQLLVLGSGPSGIELAQVVRRLGGEVDLIEPAGHLLEREPAALGQGVAQALRRDGIDVMVGVRAIGVRRDGAQFFLELEDGRGLHGDRLLVDGPRRPRLDGIGLDTVGVTTNARGILVDDHLRAGERLWAVGDVVGLWPSTHLGKYQGDVVAANILGNPRPVNYEAVPRVVYTDPQAAAVGAQTARFRGTAELSELLMTGTYMRPGANSRGFLTLLSDGERLTGAYALGPGASEWLQQATVAIRARVPIDVLRDTIQPFPSFSEIYGAALKVLYRSMGWAARRVEVPTP